MDDKVRTRLVGILEEGSWEINDRNLVSLILEADVIYREETDKHRWFTDYFYVVNVDDMLIGYTNMENHGDEGYDFSNKEFLSHVHEVKPVEVTVTKYKRV